MWSLASALIFFVVWTIGPILLDAYWTKRL
uniref:Uncharacterized protein n=1 Tax=Arundo donax TaxID=35708 RepID=A0A0A8Y180_ARUDO